MKEILHLLWWEPYKVTIKGIEYEESEGKKNFIYITIFIQTNDF